MYHIITSKSALGDIKDIAESDPTTAAEIVALIHTIGADQELLDRLTEDYFENYDDPNFDVDTWYAALNQSGISLWRIKPKDNRFIAGYRIIYAYDGTRGQDKYYILAVVPRSFEYDRNSEIADRIFDEYKYLGLFVIGHS